jgi:guanylate kinase
MKARVLVVIGPSGVGKSALISQLKHEGILELIPSWTTRAPRHYEDVREADHVFCSEQEFEQRRASGHFMETVRLFGLNVWYGLPHLDQVHCPGKIPTLLLRAPLLDRLARHVRDYRVYQVEAPFERVQAHLHVRENLDGSQGTRLQQYFDELKLGQRLAHRIVDNGQPLSASLSQFKRFLSEDFDCDSDDRSSRTSTAERALERSDV